MKTILSNKLKSQLQKLFWVTIAWTLVSVSQFYLGYITLKDFNCDLGNQNPSDFLIGSIFLGIIAGIIGGSMLVFLWEKWLRSKTYGTALLYIFISYSIVYFVVATFSELFRHSTLLGLPMTHTEVTSILWKDMTFEEDVFGYLFWLAVLLVTMITFQVNDKYGPGVFKDFLLGKYFHPRKEERIFMFLDMRSSTTIAEKLGEEKYFNLVRELFSDATAPIIYSKGEIYQYVGDEIVISWKMDNGLEQANCLNCFFEIQNKLLGKKPDYIKKYGLLPQFKAGLHYGHVMAGEVGVVKRDIAFSGDVLNTTARIQEKCNELGVNILLSKPLLEKLSISANSFNPKNMGDMLLRGKKEKLILYTI